MRIIKSPQDFNELLVSDSAVLFLNFEWSGYTKMTEIYIRKWLDKSHAIKLKNIATFEFFPDGEMDTYYFDWLTKYEKRIERKALRQLRYHGYGDVVWFQKGEVLGGISLFPELASRRNNWTTEQIANFDNLTKEEKIINITEYSMILLDKKTEELIK